LGIHLGFTFSAGAIDYVLNYGLSQRGWLAIPIGLVYGLVYYGLFRFFIRKFNMATPGREPATTDAEVESFDNTGFVSPTAGATVPRAVRYIAALGGASNLTLVDACTTRLRLSVVDSEKVSEPQLKAIGARGVLKRGATNVQVIIGPEADLISDEIRTELERSSTRGATPASSKPAAAETVPLTAVPASEQGPLDPDPVRWLAVFGGATNVASLDAVAATRLRVVVRDPSSVDRQRLSTLDVAWVSADTFHIVVGNSAPRYAATMAKRLSPGSGASPLPA
jgi:PTS system N-acetylglucosamine-specific IIC component